MRVVIDNAIIVRANASRDNALKVYLTVFEDDGEFNFAVQGQTVDEFAPVLRKPVQIQGVVEGFVFDRKQNLTFKRIDIQPASANGGTSPKK